MITFLFDFNSLNLPIQFLESPKNLFLNFLSSQCNLIPRFNTLK